MVEGVVEGVGNLRAPSAMRHAGDGRSYTLDQFLAWYGEQAYAMWEKAVPVAPPPKALPVAPPPKGYLRPIVEEEVGGGASEQDGTDPTHYRHVAPHIGSRSHTRAPLYA